MEWNEENPKWRMFRRSPSLLRRARFPRQACRLIVFASFAFAAFSVTASTSTSFAPNTFVIPMGTTHQDNGMFLAFGLVQDLLKTGIPIEWTIKPNKNYGDVDVTISSVTDVRSGATISNPSYKGGPFLVDSAYEPLASPIIATWQARYANLAVHKAQATFLADVGRRLLAAPSIAVFSDGNEKIAFGYLNAAAIPQGILPASRSGNSVTAGTASAKPTVSSAPAGNSMVTGTSTEAAGSVVQIFVDGLFAGTTTVQSGGTFSFGLTAIPPNVNVTAAVTANGKGTSQLSGNKASGNLSAGGSSAAPVLTGPIREQDGTLYGTSTEAAGTTIKIFRNGTLSGTATVASGKWSFLPGAPASGGDSWNATATAPSKTESGLSNFAITIPVPPTVTPNVTAGDTSISGLYEMTDGSPVEVHRLRGAADTVIGTDTASGAAWSIAPAGSTIVAGDVIYAAPTLFPWPLNKDNTSAYACPGQYCCPDCLSETAIKGASTLSHGDGGLLDGAGAPKFCQLMSMHYGAPGDPEVVAEVRTFLGFQTHVFLECQAVNAFENDAAAGHFLTSGGLVSANVNTSGPFYYFGQDSPFAQADGTYNNPGGSEQSYTLAGGSSYYNVNVVHVSAVNSASHGTQDVWMTGYLDGITTKGKVSFLGGHSYSTSLPVSGHVTSVGTRYFLDSLYEAPCASEAVPALQVTLSGPAYNNGGNATYTVSYTSSGVGQLKNTLVRLPLPSGTGFVSCTGGGTFSSGTVTWNLGNLDAGLSGSFTVTVSFSADGTYQFQGNGKWTAGISQLTALSGTITTIRDTVPPTVALQSPSDGSTVGETPTITGTAETGSTVKVYVDGIIVATVSADSFGNWTYSSPALAEGTHSTQAVATDAAGNSASSPVNGFTVSVVKLLRAAFTTDNPATPSMSSICSLSPLDPSMDPASRSEQSPFVSGGSWTHQSSDYASSDPLIFYEINKPGNTLSAVATAWAIVITF